MTGQRHHTHNSRLLRTSNLRVEASCLSNWTITVKATEKDQKIKLKYAYTQNNETSEIMQNTYEL